MSDRRRARLGIIFGVLGLLGLAGLAYSLAWPRTSEEILASPSIRHWFGTDLAGNDVLRQTLEASCIAVLTILVVAVGVYLGGLALGILVSYAESRLLRELLLNVVHYWLTLPILLIATFVLVLVGAGQVNVILILTFVLIPSQALYVYNRFAEAAKQDFVLAKRSLGFSKAQIYLRQMFPYVQRSLNTYTLSRLPEILIMDIAFNFLGLGVQPPHASFGRLLFDGLPFMFSAWWIWALPSVSAATVVVFLAFSPMTRNATSEVARNVEGV